GIPRPRIQRSAGLLHQAVARPDHLLSRPLRIRQPGERPEVPREAPDAGPLLEARAHLDRPPSVALEERRALGRGEPERGLRPRQLLADLLVDALEQRR